MISCTHQTTKSPKADEIKFVYGGTFNEHCATYAGKIACVW